MINRWLTLSFVFVLGATPALADDLTKFQEDSRNIVKEMASTLGSALQKEMTANGPAAAIKVCKDLAPAITSDLSRKTGQRVTRVSLKTRNPLLGSPDAWEQKVLADFALRSEKENPANIEFAEIVTEPQGKFMRYMKAIPTQEVCLKCHGPLETIAPQVKEQLNTAYPNDKATGYAINQLRGAFSIKKAL
jgi:uncharacterized protein DUF3365